MVHFGGILGKKLVSSTSPPTTYFLEQFRDWEHLLFFGIWHLNKSAFCHDPQTIRDPKDPRSGSVIREKSAIRNNPNNY